MSLVDSYLKARGKGKLKKCDGCRKPKPLTDFIMPKTQASMNRSKPLSRQRKRCIECRVKTRERDKNREARKREQP